MSSKDDFLTIFDFTLPFFKTLLQDGQIINLNNIRVVFQKYTFIPSFTKRVDIMVAATLGKNLDPPMPKRSNHPYLQENQEL